MYSCVIRTVERESVDKGFADRKFSNSRLGEKRVPKITSTACTGNINIYDTATFTKDGAVCYPMSGVVGLDGIALSFGGVLKKNTISPGYVARLGLENKQGVIDKVFLVENYGGITGCYSGIFVYADIQADLEPIVKSLEDMLEGIKTGNLDRNTCNTAEFEIGTIQNNYRTE